MQDQDALRAHFSRVSGMLPELYNIAYAITGDAERAEYVLESALLESWTDGVRRAGGFREGMRELVRRMALTEADGTGNGDGWEGLPRAEDPDLMALSTQPLAVQRITVLRYGCELPPKAIARAMGLPRSQVAEALSRVGRGEGQLPRAVRKVMAQPSPSMPPAESLYRTLRAETMEIRPARHLFSKTLGRVALAALVLLAAAAFWLTAVLIQPEETAVLLEETTIQAEK